MSEVLPSDSRHETVGYSIFRHPKFLAFAGLFVTIVLGWTYLGLMVSQMIPLMDMRDAGPGMSVFNQFSQWAQLDDFGRALLVSICGPGVLALSGSELVTFETIGFLTLMWSAMAMAMMLPTAAPMISAYVEICQTASKKNIATVSPIILVCGYASVWLGFAVIAASAQAGFMHVSILSPAMVTTHKGVASLLLIGAGLYQFSSLKQACLTKCRTPLNFFFANWSDRTRDIFKLGVKQGLFCLGCCWALMLVMFVAGIMNVIWMVLLTALMVAEKTISKADTLRRITGFSLIAWGALIGATLIFN